MKFKPSYVIAMTALSGLMLAAPMKVLAQDDVRNHVVSSLEFESADIRDALKILFREVGVSYTIAEDVQGSVTVSLKNVPFETALRNLLNQVDSTWREEGGVYNIVKREAPGNTLGGGTTDTPTVRQENRPRRIYIQSADPQLIITLLAGNTTNTSMQPETSVLTGGGGSGGMGGGMGGGSGFGGNSGFGGGGFGGGNSGFGGGGFGGGNSGFGGGGFGGGSSGFGGGGFGGGGMGGGMGGGLGRYPNGGYGWGFHGF